MANQKLTQEELDKLQEIQQKNAALIQELGQIKLGEINLQKREENAEEYLSNLRKEEGDLAKELEDKYGQGSIDLEKGEFIPAPTQQAQPAPQTETKTVQ